MVIGPRHHHLTGFEWLTKRVQHRFGEFGKLVEKQHTTMGQRDFTRACPRTATDKRRHRGGMVRIAEGSRLDQTAGRQGACNRMQHRDIKRLSRGERWQQPGKPRRQHRFPSPGRSHHQQVVRTRNSNLQHPSGGFLSLEISHVGRGMRSWQQFRTRGRYMLVPTKMIQQ